MCKVLMIPGIKKDKIPAVKRFMQVMAKPMSRMDSDGLGYAAINSKGEIYGRKWLNNDSAFVVSEPEPSKNPIVQRMKELFEGAGKFKEEIPESIVFEKFGPDVPFEDTVAVIMHTRKSTVGEKAIKNVHPFISEATESGDPCTALIHNGGITNHASLTKKTSTCDSEVILHEYLKDQVWYNPYKIKSLTNTLVGEYAVGVLSSYTYEDETVEPILDVFKSNKDLYVGYINELGTSVFATSDYNLNEACKDLGWTLHNLMEIKDGFFMRFSAITGDRIEDFIEFPLSKKFNSYQDNYNYNSQTGTYQQKDSSSNVCNLPAKNPEVLPGDTESIEVVKRRFEQRHPALFKKPYCDISKQFTEKEKAILKELEGRPGVNYIALELTKAVLNRGA
jgi:hypothetical protein